MSNLLAANFVNNMNKLRLTKDDQFYINIFALHAKGWSLQEIATSFSVSKSAVADWEKKAVKIIALAENPSTEDIPVKEKLSKSLSKALKPEQPKLSITQQQEILTLAQVASKVSRNTPLDAPSRKAAAKLEKILRYHKDRGVSYGKLAAAAGVTRRAIAQRLEKTESK